MSNRAKRRQVDEVRKRLGVMEGLSILGPGEQLIQHHQVSERPFSFLSQLDNPNNIWKFYLIGNEQITGRVTHYVWDVNGVPITVQVTIGTEDVGLTDYEVPWTSIQTIRLMEKHLQNNTGNQE